MGASTRPGETNQLAYVNAQCAGKALDAVNGNIALTSLNGTQIGSVHSGSMRKLFLRQALGKPHDPEICGDSLPG